MSNGDLHKIEDLKSKLYSRNAETSSLREHTLPPERSSVPPAWQPPETPQTFSFSSMKIFFTISLIFFLGALAYSAFLFLNGSNILSSGNIAVEIRGPVSAGGGEPLSFDVAIRNNNTVPLELADLIVEYPQGTRSASDLAKDLTRYRESLGSIAPGEQVNRRLSAALFGEEKTAKDIKVTVEYRLPGSNAVFSKDTLYTVTLSSSPLSLVVKGPTQSSSGQSVTFTLTVQSNSKEVIKGVAVKPTYPAGFILTSAEPKPDESGLWLIGDLPSQKKKEIVVKGDISGENDDARIFQFEAGLVDKDNEAVLVTPFSTVRQEVAITKAFIGLSMLVGGKSEQEIPVENGRQVRVDIAYTNNLSVPVKNAVISLALAGEALERASVQPDQGFYQSANDTVVWDRSTDPELALIAPGERGVVSLTLSARSLSSVDVLFLRNPAIKLTASVRGDRDDEGAEENVRSSITRTLKVQTVPRIAGKLSHASGALPPKVGQESVYVITWTASNTFNQIAQGEVRAQLPPNVRFVSGGTASEKLVYDQSSREVFWNVGTIKAGAGFGVGAREVSFQVAITPSLSQVGSSPTLIGETSFEGADTFTGVRVDASRSAITTKISGEEGGFSPNDVVVQ
ncbi:DUF11 domain-containing protein [Candidatus Parcubacteria bacterium]|nr:DUF11 domain-containing protein [Candidatus Parcubacteria bacterium]